MALFPAEFLVTAYYSALALLLVGAVCRGVARRARIAPPRRFRPVERGWWFPPAPLATEFATPRTRALEVCGRALMIAGSWLLLLATLARRSAS